MRLVLAALAGFALAVVPALAAEHSVKSVSGSQWSPATIEIAKGDKVVWTNADEGFHNVSFDDGEFTQPAQPSTTWPDDVSRTFDAAGTYSYVCDAHSNMKGTIVVKDAGTTGTTTQTTTSPTTTTTPPPTETTTTEQPAPTPSVTVKLARSSFCARKSRRCRRPGVVLRVTSDTAHRLQGRLLREPAGVFGTVAFDVPAGTKTVRFTRTSAGRRLTPGRYSLKLGTARSIRFRVRQ
jgi:plastocyanin